VEGIFSGSTQWRYWGRSRRLYPKGMNTNVGSEVPPPTLEEVLMTVKNLNNN
jgi:hypothetical protein